MATIKTSHGHAVLVDDADLALVSRYTWWTRKTRYTMYADGYIPELGRTTPMHCFLLGRAGVRDGKVVDHRDRHGLHNQRHNLRVVSYAVNLRNSRKRESRSEYGSQYKGVRKNSTSRGASYITYGHIDGKPVHLGSYPTERDAAMAWDNFNRGLEGATLNLPGEQWVPVPLRLNAPRPTKSATGYRGVKKIYSNKYQVIGPGGKYLGTFDSAEVAAKAYDVAAVQAYGSEAVTNFT